MRMASSFADEDGCLAEYANSLRAGALRQLGPPGTMTADETCIVFSIRARHAKAAGLPILGIENVLYRLKELQKDKVILLFHFTDGSRTFTVFVSSDEELVGCIIVPSRQGTVTS